MPTATATHASPLHRRRHQAGRLHRPSLPDAADERAVVSLTTLITRRLALGVLILLFVSVLVFVGTEVLPGDVAQAILGQGATPEIIANLRPGLDATAVARMLVLPVTVLLFTVLAHMVRMTRTTVINILTTPAIEMAILKGVGRWRLLIVHALPNALAPIANVVALNLAFLISGIVVIETLFNFAGLGRLMVEAVTTRDIPLVQVCAMIFCSVYVVLNLLADVVAIVANPRLRYPK